MKLCGALLRLAVALTLAVGCKCHAQTIGNKRDVTFQWDNNVNESIDHYRLYRSTAPPRATDGLFDNAQTIDIPAVVPTQPPSTLFTWTALPAGKAWYGVTAFNPAGTESIGFEKVIDHTVDLTIPSNPKMLRYVKPPIAKNVDKKSAVIAWETNFPAKGVLTVSSERGIQTYKKDLGTLQKVRLEGLRKASQYHFSVMAFNPKRPDDRLVSETYQFTTLVK